MTPVCTSGRTTSTARNHTSRCRRTPSTIGRTTSPITRCFRCSTLRSVVGVAATPDRVPTGRTCSSTGYVCGSTRPSTAVSRGDRDREHGGDRSTGLGHPVAALTQRVGGRGHRFEADDVVGAGGEDLRGRVSLVEAHLDTTGAARQREHRAGRHFVESVVERIAAQYL